MAQPIDDAAIRTADRAAMRHAARYGRIRDLDELRSEARLALVEHAARGGNTSNLRLLSLVIERRLIDRWRGTHGRPARPAAVSLDELREREHDFDVAAPAIEYGPIDEVVAAITAHQRPKWHDRTRAICEGLAAGLPQREIAARLGITEVRVSQLLREYRHILAAYGQEKFR